MTSDFLGLLLLFSIGTFVSSVSAAKDFRSRATPLFANNHTSPCFQLLDKALRTNDSRLKDFYLRGADITCKPDFQVTMKQVHEIYKCAKGPDHILPLHPCPPIQSRNCSETAKTFNCLLDRVGASCGGKVAVVVCALEMEYLLLTKTQSTGRECEIVALQERQKQPKMVFQPVPLKGPEYHIHDLCKPIAEGFANLTSDPEYFEQRAAAILCDGKEFKKFVNESNECFERILADPDMKACSLVSDDCIGKAKELRCQAELFGKQCGGQPAVDVFAFETELTIEYTTTSAGGHPRFLPCRGEILAELRALQKPKEDSSKEH